MVTTEIQRKKMASVAINCRLAGHFSGEPFQIKLARVRLLKQCQGFDTVYCFFCGAFFALFLLVVFCNKYSLPNRLGSRDFSNQPRSLVKNQ